MQGHPVISARELRDASAEGWCRSRALAGVRASALRTLERLRAAPPQCGWVWLAPGRESSRRPRAAGARPEVGARLFPREGDGSLDVVLALSTAPSKAPMDLEFRRELRRRRGALITAAGRPIHRVPIASQRETRSPRRPTRRWCVTPGRLIPC